MVHPRRSCVVCGVRLGWIGLGLLKSMRVMLCVGGGLGSGVVDEAGNPVEIIGLLDVRVGLGT